MHIFRIMNHINIGTQSHYIVGLLSMNDSSSDKEYKEDQGLHEDDLF